MGRQVPNSEKAKARERAARLRLAKALGFEFHRDPFDSKRWLIGCSGPLAMLLGHSEFGNHSVQEDAVRDALSTLGHALLDEVKW